VTEPAAGAIFAVNMLVGTPGASYSEAEVRTWLEEAGFTDLQRLDPEPTAGIMMARKA